ncbi:diguanylate cyclase domain-containing protein [Actinokineospora sp. G85]|uniref:diguanylate cyclase domain-containing protein n=1 Tax=Actinokineospora sp. G85 TaxID=3406626 RepID=UPI003C71478C
MSAEEGLVDAWLRAVAATAYVPRSSTDVRTLVAGLADSLVGALSTEPFDPAVGEDVGARMVSGALTGENTLSSSLGVLSDGLVAEGFPAGRVVRLLAAVSAGYASALRTRTLEQQEDLKRALLGAVQQAERGRRDTEHRFREVFTEAATGIAITDADRRLVEVNPALAEILGSPAGQLCGTTLEDHLVGDDPVSTTPARREVLRPDGESAWALVSSSIVRDEGRPDYAVTMVQDLSEVELLGTRLSHQSLHDALTGLPNRSYFTSRAETLLAQQAPTASATLACLDLDGFGMLNATHGHEAGDQLLRAVAARLTRLVENEHALVARVDGDEFAVLLLDGPATPGIPELVALVRAELAEPYYDGDIGLAVTAAIGVVRRPVGELSAAELHRAASVALGVAKATGPDQWAVHDPQDDRRARRLGAAATALPAAHENGELVVAYDRVIGLAERSAVRVRALVLAPEARSDLPEVLDLAELTGFSVALAPWLLTTAARQLPVWRAMFPGGGPVLRVRLSRSQTADADLAGSVREALAAAAVAPSLLELLLDTPAVVEARGDARDNLRTLVDMGVTAGLHRFSGGPVQLELAERFGVRSVVLGDPFSGWRPDWLPADAVAVRATRTLLSELASIGLEVGVLGVRDQAEATWWADNGATTGEGIAFGGPADVEDILHGESAAK